MAAPVRQRPPGDWKLIRIFHGGEEGQHRWKLFNLANDPGEQHDLAAQLPDRVQQLDGLIETFLADTEAVLPLPNPEFDPARYQPELEGKATLKGSTTPPTQAASPSKERVAGWLPQGHCGLTVKEHSLLVNSTGGDPHFSFNLPQPIAPQPLVLRFTMSSQSAGGGQLFWHEDGVRPAYHRDRSVTFEAQHDGQPREYSIEFTPERPVLGIRIDPSSGAGELSISDLRLTTTDGEERMRWEF